jgi:ligand-binding SRPBCC domain-containing protein
VRTVERTSDLAAPAAEVWDRIVTAEGINDEMRPWPTMSLPPHLSAQSLTHLPLGVPLGRAWLRAFGVVPLECDHLVLIDLEPGRRFQECSSMITVRRWEHERTLTPLGTQTTRIHDRVTFDARLGERGAEALMNLLVGTVFTHRHRRLRRRFGPARTSPDGLLPDKAITS